MKINPLLILIIAVAMFGCDQKNTNQESADNSAAEVSKETNKEQGNTVKAVADDMAVLLNKIDADVAMAISNNDYRLLATSGRRITFPGISNDDFDFAEKNCGKNILASMGDVVKSDEQRAARTEKLKYMKAYNQAMFKICQSKQ